MSACRRGTAPDGKVRSKRPQSRRRRHCNLGSPGYNNAVVNRKTDLLIKSVREKYGYVDVCTGCKRCMLSYF